MASTFESLARRYAAFSRRQPWGLLVFYMALTIVAVFLAKYGLEIRTSLESLLPQGTSSVAALDESRQRTGSTDLYTIAITSPDPEANVRTVKAVAERLEKWPETEWVQVDRDASFFSEHALLYLPMEDLTKLRDQLADEIKLEKKYNNPFFADMRTPEEIEAENQKRWAMDRWLAPDLPLRLGLDTELFDSILSPDKLGLPKDKADGDDAKPADAKDAPKDAPAAEPPKPALPSHLKPYLISEDGTVAVVLAKLSQPATDVAKSKELYERGEAMLAEMKVEQYHPELRAVVAGAYRNFDEVKSISNDSQIATIVSVFLVLGILIGFFRNARSVFLLIYPLAQGVVWSVGLTALTYGHLNISTLFVFTMLIGMGIDFGIHYYSRIQEERRRGQDWEEAITQATIHSGRAMLSAALTTIVALLTLLAAHFQGFVEFGVIASYGIALCLVAFIVVLPPTIFALERVWASKAPETPSDAAATAHDAASESPPWIRKAAFALMAVGLTGSVLAGLHWDEASFEHDFRNLRGESSGTGISYGKAVGRGKSTSPAMILGKSQDEMREVHEVLAKRFIEKEGKGYINSFVTIQTYVPPNQTEKHKVIQEINALVEDPKLNRSKGSARALIDRMRSLSKVEPFEVDAIPGWARRSIKEKNGDVGAIGFLYSSVQKWDALDVQRFQDELGLIKIPSGREVPVASSGFILSDVIRTVKDDALTLMPFVFGVILLVLLIDLRSPKGAFVCLATMAVALLWTIGGMVLFDIRLGLYNMIVLPMVLGTGIDGSIHIYHRTMELGSHRLWYVLKTTGLSVVVASSTTLAGFAGLLAVSHKGVKSIGDLAVVGILATLLAVMSFMPGMLLLMYRGHRGHPAPKAEAADA